MNNSYLEVEVKFWLADLSRFRERLVAAGAIPHKARQYERNVRFDMPDQQLLQRQQLLRLRQDTAVTLTFKGLSDADATSEAKIREEVEVTVSDFDTTALLLTRLGFAPVQVYEKYRETFTWQGVEIVLDELPYGNFVELEGAAADLKKVAAALSLDWSQRLDTNYLALMAAVKAFYQLDFDDLTFTNFQDVPVHLPDMLPMLQERNP